MQCYYGIESSRRIGLGGPRSKSAVVPILRSKLVLRGRKVDHNRGAVEAKWAGSLRVCIMMKIKTNRAERGIVSNNK